MNNNYGGQGSNYGFYSRNNKNNGNDKEEDVFASLDIDSKGYLTEEDFINYYKKCCKTSKKAEAVWANLKKLHYREDLKLPEEVTDV